MPPILNLEDALPSSQTLVPRPQLVRASTRTRQLTPRLARQLTPSSDTSRSTFSPPFTPAHSPPQAILDEIIVEEKQEEGKEQSLSSEEGNHPRPRTFSEEGSIVTLDENCFETVPSPSLENKPDASDTTSERRLYLMGFALPHWWTSRPSKIQVSSFIVKCAPCFWCTKPSGLAMTSRSIVLRLIVLCAIFGLIQTASASYLLVVALSDKIVNRHAEHVEQEGAGDYTLSLWSNNTAILFAGIVGTVIFFVMLFTWRAIAEVDFSCSLRFMWFMLWAVPVEIYATVSMFDLIIQVNEVRGKTEYGAMRMV